MSEDGQYFLDQLISAQDKKERWYVIKFDKNDKHASSPTVNEITMLETPTDREA